ncbi:beta-lactamase [Gleimia coleocanis DSM 15436]|uniref:Beta-lactamase n=1 Tax=Gleimia coleocanis DSM 15436 TaxID=525245 RepID=C0VYD4_9ACTO|nr:serine hydrolase domain-containing protein [Gleimia coleocanis]EEH64437.1 beta-lactamase [Gleimia coleocanis DSM 15436]
MIPAELTPDFPFAVAFFDETQVRFSAGDLVAVFPFASVTKLFASRAILMAVERGFIGLDEVRAVGIPAEETSLRALLSHVSGVSFSGPERVSVVGQKRTYTNYAIEVAGDWVAERMHVPFMDWLDEAVIGGLFLEDTYVEGSCAHAGMGSVRDLVTFGRELLNPRLISSALAVEARTVQWPGIRGVTPGFGSYPDNTWGLGMEIRRDKERTWFPSLSEGATFGHFGQAGSFLWVAPESRFGAAFLGAEPAGDWHKANWRPLNDWMISSFS